jgi:hypothetical protein
MGTATYQREGVTQTNIRRGLMVTAKSHPMTYKIQHEESWIDWHRKSTHLSTNISDEEREIEIQRRENIIKELRLQMLITGEE